MACHLIQGISNSLNLEILKLDSNALTHVFVEKLAENFIANKIRDAKSLDNSNLRSGYQSNHSLLHEDSNGSFLGGSEDNYLLSK